MIMLTLPKIGVSGHPLIGIPPTGYGAVEKILYERAKLLAEKGYKIHIISRPQSSLGSFVNQKLRHPFGGIPSFNANPNLSFHYCSFPRYSIYYSMMKLRQDLFYRYVATEARNASLDLLHTSYPPYTKRLRKLLPISLKIVTEITTSIDEEFTKKLGKLAEASDLILTVSDFVGQFVKSVIDKPVETLYNAVDTDAYYPAKEGKKNIIVCSSKVMRWKGQHVLLEALSHIDLATWTVNFVGPPVETEYYEECVKKARSISKNIHFLGFIPECDLRKLYGKAAIFVCPSIGFEAFGVVNIEAMSSGCAVIGTQNGGIPEIIEDGKNGVLVTPNDPLPLAEGLIRLMDDEVLRRRLGENARRSVLKRFTYRGHVEDLIKIYKKHGML